MDIRLRFLTAEIAILTAIATLFNTQSPEWTKVYERRLYAEMALNMWRGGNEQTTGEEAGVSAMAPICETMVEAKDPRTPLAAEAENYSQSLAQRAESEAVNEQTAEEETGSERQTVQEVAVETLLQNSCPETETFRTEDDSPNDQADPPEETGLNGPEPVDDITSHTEEAAAMAVDQDPPLYSVNGAVMPAELQEYLYNRLADCGIGWFMPYAVLIAYQESRFDIYAQNPNGLDKGLFQYRLPYWEEFTAEAGRSGSDIFDPYAQVDVFAFQMARRAFQGFDVNSMISKHNMSDYGPFNQVYVDQVLQHMTVLAAY